MFAQILNAEEKAKFLELIYKTATCDSDYAEEEQELVNNYKIELGLNEIPESAEIKELIDYFGAKNSTIRRAVFFEIVGMIQADDKVEETETKIMETMKQSFALPPQTYDCLMEAVRELQQAYDKVYAAVFD
ncbi:MAG: hypothetical protein LIP12_13295 [Clostridiales bacterium]|nr:hypothetical protein [Clostridiales bacterium]